MMKVLLIGANNPEVIRLINAVKAKENIEVAGFLDNDSNKRDTSFFGYKVLGGFELLPQVVERFQFVNVITRSPIVRYETSRQVAKAGGSFRNLIHPSINLEMVKMGVGNYIQENVILQAGVTIGNNSSIHVGSIVAHECVVGNSVFIAHGCNISGIVSIEDGVFIGAGVTVLPRLKIGKWATVGAGAVVTKDVPDYSTVVGCPARVIKTGEKKYKSGDIFS